MAASVRHGQTGRRCGAFTVLAATAAALAGPALTSPSAGAASIPDGPTSAYLPVGPLRLADTRQDDAIRATDKVRIFCQRCSDAESFECVSERRDVGTAAVYDCNVTTGHANTPLVEGSSLPSWRIAWRNARPTDLKQASTM